MDRADNRRRGRYDVDSDKAISSSTANIPDLNIPIYDTVMVCQLNTQVELPAEDTCNGFVVWGLPYEKLHFSRQKKAGCHRGESSKSSPIEKRKESFDHENGSVDVVNAVVPADEKLSFEKHRFLWEVAESTEAFSKMPQNPHFRPLESFKEILREGKALGLMVIFDTIAKNTLNLQCDTPRKAIENDLSLLEMLETNGFDVVKMKDRLTRMLSLKDEEKDLDDLSKVKKMRLTEFVGEKCKATEKLAKIKDKMVELMDEAELTVSRGKKVSAEFASEVSAYIRIDDQLARTSTKIEELVTSPLY